jgi:hypothetical protein
MTPILRTLRCLRESGDLDAYEAACVAYERDMCRNSERLHNALRARETAMREVARCRQRHGWEARVLEEDARRLVAVCDDGVRACRR